MSFTHFSVDDGVRLFLALYFISIAGFYFQRLVFKKPAKKRVHAGEPYSSHWLGHFLFRFFRAAILLVCVARVFAPQLDHYLGVCPLLNIPVLQLSGVGMLVLGFAIVLLAHFDLGDYWRSGVDPQGPESLVTTGLYARSRNPIFIGVITAQLGFFFALPSVFSFVCLVAGVLVIRRQVRLEEQHLSQPGGGVYQNYRLQVPRWFSLSAFRAART